MAWEYLKFFHLVFGFVLVSGIVLAAYAEVMAPRTRDLGQFEAYLKVGNFGGMLAGLGTVMASVFGILTAWQQNWPLTSTGWLSATYVVMNATTITTLITLKRYGDRAVALMPEARAGGGRGASRADRPRQRTKGPIRWALPVGPAGLRHRANGVQALLAARCAVRRAAVGRHR